jgi:hypothetical protein
MSFYKTNTRPSPNSRVTVRFSGLLLLKPGPNGNTCEIGVHRTSTSPHSFHVMLIINKPGQPLTFIRLLTGPLTSEFNIEVQPTTTGFRVFERDPGPFDRSDNRNDVFDSRWAVNMAALHPGVDFNDGARPVVRLNEGILYTGNLTRENLRPVLGLPNTAGEPQHRIAADLAAAIDLHGEAKVMLSWENGQSLELPRPLEEAGTTYTILLLNEPPGLGGDAHNEFTEYYEVLEVNGKEIEDGDQFQLDFESQPTTDEIPCMSVTINP